jgi:glycosyltransferase involved in cell wall biosynthesis
MSPEKNSVRPQVSVIVWVPFGARSRELARALTAPCHFVSVLALQRPMLAPIKYPILTWKTWRLLQRERPKAIIVQNPPLPAVACVALYSSLNGTAFIIDSHSAALVGAKWAWSRPLQRWLGRAAAATLVHTETLVPRMGGRGRTLVLEDPPPSLPPARRDEQPHASRVVVIGSFADDEPVAETLSAAARFPQAEFVLTGDSRILRSGLTKELPPNVRMPGWLSFQDYADLLRSATVIMSLTTRDMTVLRGGWEAVYLGKPLVVSNWPALRSCFTKGAIFVDNDSGSIAAGVAEAMRNLDELSAAMRRLKDEKRESWEDGLQTLRDLLAISPAEPSPSAAVLSREGDLPHSIGRKGRNPVTL